MRRLGQHFLTKRRILEKITAALCIKPKDTIIEIGPGHGELTLLLAQAGATIIAIEKDQKLVQLLKRKIGNGEGRIKIYEGDALKILPKIFSSFQFPVSNYKLVGNIPYYITGHLLRIISELDKKPKSIVLTIQKEVAERIISQPPKMNLLAASVQFWAKPEILGIIPKKDFKPMPKVNSAIIKLKPSQRMENGEWRMVKKCFYELIKTLFKQPRKTILNNLRGGGLNQEKIKEIFGKLKINLSLRPQNLTMRQIIEISKNIKANHML